VLFETIIGFLRPLANQGCGVSGRHHPAICASATNSATYGNQAHPGGAQGDAIGHLQPSVCRAGAEGEEKMSAADKLQEFAKMIGAASRPRAQAASIVAGPSQHNPIAAEDTTVDSAPVKLESADAKTKRRQQINQSTTEQSRCNTGWRPICVALLNFY
jgi:hypothetical protein